MPDWTRKTRGTSTVKTFGAARARSIIRFLAIVLMSLTLTASNGTAQMKEESGSANFPFCKTMLAALDNNGPGVNWRQGYCFGVVTTAMTMLILYNGGCFPRESTFGQSLRVFVTYMERHPERLHIS